MNSMRTLLLTAIGCTLIHLATAQDKERPLVVGVKLGPSIPVGKMAKSPSFGLPHDNSGNALPGFTGDILALYRLNKNWGVSLNFGGAINKQNTRERIRQLRTYFPSGTSVAAEYNSWKSFRAMAGVHYVIPLTADGKLELQPGISLGACKTAIPGYKASYHYTANDQTGIGGASISENQPVPWLFCYQADLSFNIHVSRRVFIILDLAYFNASPTQKYVYDPDQTYPANPFSVTTTPGSSTFVSAEKKYALSSINPLAGIAIKF